MNTQYNVNQVFSKKSEDFVRKNIFSILPNKDVNKIIIDHLIDMRKEAKSILLAEKVIDFPKLDEYPRRFIRCNGRRYNVDNGGPSMSMLDHIKKDIIENRDQTLTIRFPMPLYEIDMHNLIGKRALKGWNVYRDSVIEPNNPIRHKQACEGHGYDSCEENDIVEEFEIE